MVQHLAPDLVHDDRLEAARDGGARVVEPDLIGRHGARTFYDTIEHAPNGVLGDQTEATAEKGERLFSAATDHLVRLCEWMAELDGEELVPKPHV